MSVVRVTSYVLSYICFSIVRMNNLSACHFLRDELYLFLNCPYEQLECVFSANLRDATLQRLAYSSNLKRITYLLNNYEGNAGIRSIMNESLHRIFTFQIGRVPIIQIRSSHWNTNVNKAHRSDERCF